VVALVVAYREQRITEAAKGKLRGTPPKLNARQESELRRVHATGTYTVADLAEVFSVSRPTMYRVLNRATSSITVPGPRP
jgi:DNA invertase Pin-like site-specific DNA recombinase